MTKKLDPYHLHEALDRTHLITEMIENYLLNHPAFMQNKDWSARAQKASDVLHKLYQEIGAAHLE